MSADLDHALQLDADDPLASFRDRFVLPGPETVYLNGNSLGCLPRDALERLDEVVKGEWGTGLSRSWGSNWGELPLRIGDLLATGVLGAGAGDVVATDSTTIGLYKLAWAALDARPGRDVIVADVHDFPTDRYVLEGLAAARGAEIRWISSDPVEGPSVGDVESALGGDVALVCVSHVGYRSGAILDAAAVVGLAHEGGAMVLLDLSHSVGVLEIGLSDLGADLAVGCTYKYLSGGPGAPAFLYVRPDLQEELQQPIWGWWGRRDSMAMGQGYERADGISGYLGGSPAIIGLAVAEAGVRVVAEAGPAALRRKSVALTEFAKSCFGAYLVPVGFRFGSPWPWERRGSHVSFRHADGRELVQRLLKAGVVVDFRDPDSIRFGLAPLTTRFVDVYEGCRRLAELASET